jgi:hypothetical protein
MRVIEGAHVVTLGRARDAGNSRLHRQVRLAKPAPFDKNLHCAIVLAATARSCEARRVRTRCRLNRVEKRVLPLGQSAPRNHVCDVEMR